MSSRNGVLGKRKAPDEGLERTKLLERFTEMLECPICFEMMKGPIYQCHNGHVLCANCIGKLPSHEAVNADDFPHIRACAECRGKMDVTNPVRNRMAEDIRDNVELRCPNVGCSEELPMAKCGRHAEHDCLLRPSRKGVFHGHRYEGQWKDGAPDGEGTVYGKNTRYVAYSGQWKQGRYHGEGTEHWSRSILVKYKGQWKAGQRDGTGIFYDKDGTHTKYVGGWKDGTYDGHGTSYSGAIGGHTRLYKGGWKCGAREGTGTLWRTSGKFAYRGEWEDNVPHGEGTEYDTNGAEIYDGQWHIGFRARVEEGDAHSPSVAQQ